MLQQFHKNLKTITTTFWFLYLQVPSPIPRVGIGQFGEKVLPRKSSMPPAHIGGLFLNTLELEIVLSTIFVEPTTFLYKDCENSLPPFVHPRTPPTPPKNFSKRNKRQERNFESNKVARELDFVGNEPLSQTLPNLGLDQSKTLNLKP
jgi:hypothetical protein